ncbi:MAG: TIGR02710 family CRISPR-associated protein [Nitrospirales bacterium]|nr:TIGR02710 family CRISPR-associated protein [Nitrospirales bacterium]
MSIDGPIKALFVAIGEDPATALYTINRLAPEFLCLCLPETSQSLVETHVQPHVATMPHRWDWILLKAPHQFQHVHQELAQHLPPMLKTWGIHSGDLVVDLSASTPAMASAMVLVSRTMASRIVQLTAPHPDISSSSNIIDIEGTAKAWLSSNMWDEEAVQARAEASRLFNQGAFHSAAQGYRHIESLVSGGLKPLYHALGELSEGYALWEHFQYRLAWDKLKSSLKALELASIWGGPTGLASVLTAVKANVKFLESLVMDPDVIKRVVSHDLFAHAQRLARRDQHVEAATMVLLRALEAYVQYQLWVTFHIKSWDVQLEQLPQALQETCRHCYLDDIDGKYKLSLQTQFHTLAGLGHPMGQAFLSEWTKLKPLLDASQQAILGHGFEPIKKERFHQLVEIVTKLTNLHDTSLPTFPHMNLS